MSGGGAGFQPSPIVVFGYADATFAQLGNARAQTFLADAKAGARAQTAPFAPFNPGDNAIDTAVVFVGHDILLMIMTDS